MAEQIVQVIGAFLLGGCSVALITYMKFEGRTIATSTLLKAHLEETKQWRRTVEENRGKLEERLEKVDSRLEGIEKSLAAINGQLNKPPC